MNAPKLPDPIAAARAEAQRITDNRSQSIDGPVERFFGDCHFVDKDSALDGITDFYRESLQRVPSVAKYPESKPWVEYRIALDAELQKASGLSDIQLAVFRCLDAFTRYRGFMRAKPAQSEKCRIAYLPDSDRGEMHIKNVDDPPTFWKPSPPLEPEKYERPKMSIDGVGSGMHIDDEPEEIFPLDARNMVFHYADDTPGAVEFLTRYCPFWSGQNVVIEDDQKRSVAIEKCSANFIEVFEPGPTGRSHCSGMATRDPNSPQGKYQRAKRQQFLERFDLPVDGSDASFWAACDKAEQMLADCVANLGEPASFDKLVTTFTTAWPDGLRKTGALFHPDQALPEYTLYAHLTLHDERKYMRWQCNEDLEFQAEPDVADLI